MRLSGIFSDRLGEGSWAWHNNTISIDQLVIHCEEERKERERERERKRERERGEMEG